MKTLTIKQPWATLIVEGYKEYEFRSWKTNYRGKILIHAGLTLEKDMLKRFESYNLNYITGAIIGEAYITDCILVDEKFNNELRILNSVVYARSNHIEKYAWKLENIKKYDEPIYIKGKLGLWNYEPKVHELRLNNEPFCKIKNGVKNIEIRLYDEKRRLINENDIIEFKNRETDEIMSVRVIKLHKFKTFQELYNNFNKMNLGYDKDEISNYNDMYKYYSKEEECKYGVVGIEIELI